MYIPFSGFDLKTAFIALRLVIMVNKVGVEVVLNSRDVQKVISGVNFFFHLRHALESLDINNDISNALTLGKIDKTWIRPKVVRITVLDECKILGIKSAKRNTG